MAPSPKVPLEIIRIAGMVLAGLLWGCLFQSDPVRSLEALTMANTANARNEELHRKDASDQERRQFEEKFNKLIDALQGFTQEYNRSNGHVWPAKKVEAVNKALRELEQTRPWRGNKADNPDRSANAEGGGASKSGNELTRP
jgi:hypothetical protein